MKHEIARRIAEDNDRRAHQAREATTCDLHRDGSNLETGAWVYKDFDGQRHPITIVSDTGVLYEYVMGHVSVNSSNNRSNLFYNAE